MRRPVLPLAAVLLLAAPASAPARTIAWDRQEAVAASSIGAVTVARRHVTRFTVRRGDTPVHSGERTERVASVAATAARPGTQQVYRWSTRFPTTFEPVADSTWNIFTQFHESAPDGCHPNIALQVNTQKVPAMLRLQVRGGGLGPDCAPQQSRSWDFAPLVRGRWQDLELRVGWSATVDGGSIALSLDGATVVERTPLATLYSGQRAYLKQGFYRAPSPFVSTVLHSAVVVDPA